MKKRGFNVNGERLLDLIHRRGWSQQDLADKSGLDVRTVAKVRRGGNCDSSTLRLLASSLGVEPEELLAVESKHEADNADVSSEQSAYDLSEDFRIEQSWKIIDLRSPDRGDGVLCGMVWERSRFLKKKDSTTRIVFPYLTWGEGIECIEKPESAEWHRVAVEPGDIVHSDKQWELSTTTPEGPSGTEFEFGPVCLRFVNAFHGQDQQWWQVRAAYEIRSLVVQVLFSLDLPCKSITGTWALPGQRKFSMLPRNQPFLLSDGTLAGWEIPNPVIGAFYKLTWTW